MTPQVVSDPITVPAPARWTRGFAQLHRMGVAVLMAAALVLTAHPASARRAGIAATGCDGCHNGKEPEVSVSANATATTIALKQMVTLTVAVSAANGPVAGLYLTADGVGTFQIIDPGTKLEGSGVIHNAPRTGSGGQTTFTAGWTAPDELSGVVFSAYVLSANGDGRSSGDGAGAAFASYAIGCETGTKYYRDFDGDGYGGVGSGTIVSCTQTPLYGKMGGDCDDNSEVVHPGAAEACDGRDNDCDGQIDDNLTVTTYCQDDDGDGHGVRNGTTIESCGVTKGFGLCDNDCNDANKTVFPGAQEVCNNRDDNCAGGIDENARLECGVGWCRRYGAGCGSTSVCTPGKPMRETCNLFDDDCDGVDDNGTSAQLCGDDALVCHEGRCVRATSKPDGGDQQGAGGTGSDGVGGSSGSPQGSGGSPDESGGSPDESGGSTAGEVTTPNGDSGGGCAVSTRCGAPVSAWASAALMGLMCVLRRRLRRGRPAARIRVAR